MRLGPFSTSLAAFPETLTAKVSLGSSQALASH